jgi:toxin-antitoxin system PIN domain toxin
MFDVTLCYNLFVRTTLSLDDDILVIVKEMAVQQGKSAGEVVSNLVRKALVPAYGTGMRTRNGVPLLSPVAGAERPTLDLINRLRDEE